MAEIGLAEVLGRQLADNPGLATQQKARPRFAGRGFSGRTIDALVNAGLDAPERLGRMDPAAVKAIPGIGPASAKEIAAYVATYFA